MKIEASIRIGDLPRGGWIRTVGPDIEFEIDKDQFTIAEAIEIRDALTKIIEFVSQDVPAMKTFRIFGRDDPEPADVRLVKDKDGDDWYRNAAGVWTGEDGSVVKTWSHLLIWAPLTEVTEP